MNLKNITVKKKKPDTKDYMCDFISEILEKTRLISGDGDAVSGCLR